MVQQQQQPRQQQQPKQPQQYSPDSGTRACIKFHTYELNWITPMYLKAVRKKNKMCFRLLMGWISRVMSIETTNENEVELNNFEQNKAMAITRRNIVYCCCVRYGSSRKRLLMVYSPISVPISQCSLCVRMVDISGIWIQSDWNFENVDWIYYDSYEIAKSPLFHPFQCIRSKKIPFHTFHFVGLFVMIVIFKINNLCHLLVNQINRFA